MVFIQNWMREPEVKLFFLNYPNNMVICSFVSRPNRILEAENPQEWYEITQSLINDIKETTFHDRFTLDLTATQSRTEQYFLSCSRIARLPRRGMDLVKIVIFTEILVLPLY